ncbi:competence protein CoiA [Planococcus salinus]|uniref:Competence protein CoiA n=1 Tax=Planococcus salinus TaxID=1848460 RepID=A0A3M8P470_9BACL|nr:competence protein CoiA family protein [Planococcus salinus]RNF38478.1 competence protein CoiA [Planococcus salinus]
MIHILTAFTKDQKLFYLTDAYAREELLTLRNKEQFFCPICGASVILKIGDIKIPHFSHRSLSECDAFSEPESSLHLQGKRLLHHFFHRHQLPVEIEKYLPAIRQRADLLVNGQTAVEFQCSPISVSHITKRTEGYKKLNIGTLWIKGVKEQTEDGIQLIRLKAHERAFFQKNKGSSYLVLFLPEANRFFYYSNLFYISGNRWVGKGKQLTAEQQSFPFGIPRRLSKEEFRQLWVLYSRARRQFIASQAYSKNRYQNVFWRCCYELRLDMKNFPDSIGLPLEKAECIAEHAVLWQLKVLTAKRKGISMFALANSGKIPIAAFASIEEVVKLLETFVKLHQLMEQKEAGPLGIFEIMYESYC